MVARSLTPPLLTSVVLSLLGCKTAPGFFSTEWFDRVFPPVLLKALEIPQHHASTGRGNAVTRLTCRNRQSRAVSHPSPQQQLALPGLWAGESFRAAPAPPSAPSPAGGCPGSRAG